MGREPKSSLQAFGRSELKAVFRRILQTLYANTSISRREKLGGEMIKIILQNYKMKRDMLISHRNLEQNLAKRRVR